MRLSICIPVFNRDMKPLLEELRKQMEAFPQEIELLVIDDASSAEFKRINESAKIYADFWHDSPINLGRSKIRNAFLKYIQGEYILFLDCDALIPDSAFLEKYLQAIHQNPEMDLFYGSFDVRKDYLYTLRNKYSSEREIPRKNQSEDLAVVQTINFIIKTSCLEEFQFDESLTQYGYEDFIFMQRLKKAGKKVFILENPVIHDDTTSNTVFLDKTIKAVESLYQLSLNKENEGYLNEIRLYSTAKKLKALGLKNVGVLGYKMIRRFILKSLKSKNPNLFYYDLFKLGELLKIMK